MNLKSMTGFSQATGFAAGCDIAVSIKSVNSKNLDIKFLLPADVENIDNELRAIVSEYVSRGRLDVRVTIEDDSEKQNKEYKVRLQIDEKFLKDSLLSFDELEESISIRGKLVDSLLNSSGFQKRAFLYEEVKETGVFAGKLDNEELKVALIDLFRSALSSLIKMREVEGEQLSKIISNNLDRVANLLTKIENIQKDFGGEQHLDSLKKKYHDLLSNIEVKKDILEHRILAEFALLIEKGDITEEVDRLRGHINHFRDIATQDNSDQSCSTQSYGKRLSFLVQEFLREVNTINSKSKNIEIQHLGVELKGEIDRLREQLMNVE